MIMPRNGKKYKGHYNRQFKYDICMNDSGVPGECMDWCESHCTAPWGWWFEGGVSWANWDWRDNIAYMSFKNKKDAMRFWFENVKVIDHSRRSE